MNNKVSYPSSTPLRTLQTLLLDLLSPAHPVEQSRIDVLTDADWQGLMALVRQHRIAPLLHWQLGQSHKALALPETMIDFLAKGFKHATWRSLMQQRELVLVHRILQDAKIPHIALKGAYLALHVYPQASLRPMRDLDILVPAEYALSAYQRLQESGLQRMDGHLGTPELAIQLKQHFPPLKSRLGNVMVELHNRALHPSQHHPDLPDLSADPQFWKRAGAAPVGDAKIPFEGPTDLLFHLMVHAVYDHQLNNGPLVLSDLALLLRTHAIDWPLLWTLADTGHYTRGCVLMLVLTQRYWGELPIEWSGAASVIAREMAHSANTDQAALLLLQDMESRRDLLQWFRLTEKKSVRQALKYMWDRLFITKTEMAATQPVSKEGMRIYLWYAKRFWSLLLKRTPGILRSRKKSHLHQLQQLADLEAWIRHP